MPIVPNKIRTIFISVVVLLHCNTNTLSASRRSAVVIVPVADMVGNPYEVNPTAHSSLMDYNAIPLCGGPIPRCYLNCPRIHQLLFNEVVHIVQEQGDQVNVALDNSFYVDSLGIRRNRFWTHKTFIMPLKQLTQYGCSLDHIPPTVGPGLVANHQKKIITLQDPWYDSVSQRTFAAGTRFVATNQPTHNETIDVMILDPQKYTYYHAKIPTKLCAPEQHKNNQEQITQYVNLVRHWANDNDGFIPYVFGGCSFTHVSNAPFKTHTVMNNNEETLFFTIADTDTPKTGLDCSGLIARAAQICGIPYFFKNTATLAKYLKPIKQEALAEGDLIWMQGHVMIVSDLKSNVLVEARAYDHGYGKVQEIALGRVFKDMHTYAELLAAHKAKKPLMRLDKNGVVCGSTITEWKLLRFASVWE